MKTNAQIQVEVSIVKHEEKPKEPKKQDEKKLK
jgi:hypothetical protein